MLLNQHRGDFKERSNGVEWTKEKSNCFDEAQYTHAGAGG